WLDIGSRTGADHTCREDSFSVFIANSSSDLSDLNVGHSGYVHGNFVSSCDHGAPNRRYRNGSGNRSSSAWSGHGSVTIDRNGHATSWSCAFRYDKDREIQHRSSVNAITAILRSTSGRNTADGTVP